jgi:hypothetical protein
VLRQQMRSGFQELEGRIRTLGATPLGWQASMEPGQSGFGMPLPGTQRPEFGSQTLQGLGPRGPRVASEASSRTATPESGRGFQPIVHFTPSPGG